jgi:hypothetical protein
MPIRGPTPDQTPQGVTIAYRPSGLSISDRNTSSLSRLRLTLPLAEWRATQRGAGRICGTAYGGAWTCRAVPKLITLTVLGSKSARLRPGVRDCRRGLVRFA